MIYVSWDRPRRFSVRLWGKSGKSAFGHHITVGIVALSVDRAIGEAQRLYPEMRIDSVNDTGEITSVVDAPELSVNVA
jgi:hypothetical protein